MDDEPANTSRRTPLRAAASITSIVPSTLTALVARGSSTERATDGIAASWRMTSQPAAASSSAEGSRMLPWT